MLRRLALRTNIAALAPWVLPLSELVKCAMDKAYTPDFKKAFDHFLVHTGGRAVIEASCPSKLLQQRMKQLDCLHTCD